MKTECTIEGRLQEVEERLGDAALTRQTLAVLGAMAPDPVNKPRLISWLEEGLAKDDRRWEIRTALRALARTIRPRSYLEIGTRRGWSLAQVLSEAPRARVYAIDMWVEDYGGVANPGPRFLRGEIARCVPSWNGALTLISGNSHDILPTLLEGRHATGGDPGQHELLRLSEDRPRLFDLVTVDGDHTALGAWWDLLDVMPHVALGGAVVFDDLLDTSDESFGEKPACAHGELRPPLPEERHSLLYVWREIQRVFPNYVYLENLEGFPPIGVAIRME